MNLRDAIVCRAILNEFGRDQSVRELIRLARKSPDFKGWIEEQQRVGRRILALKLLITKRTMRALGAV